MALCRLLVGARRTRSVDAAGAQHGWRDLLRHQQQPVRRVAPERRAQMGIRDAGTFGGGRAGQSVLYLHGRTRPGGDRHRDRFGHRSARLRDNAEDAQCRRASGDAGRQRKFARSRRAERHDLRRQPRDIGCPAHLRDRPVSGRPAICRRQGLLHRGRGIAPALHLRRRDQAGYRAVGRLRILHAVWQPGVLHAEPSACRYRHQQAADRPGLSLGRDGCRRPLDHRIGRRGGWQHPRRLDQQRQFVGPFAGDACVALEQGDSRRHRGRAWRRQGTAECASHRRTYGVLLQPQRRRGCRRYRGRTHRRTVLRADVRHYSRAGAGWHRVLRLRYCGPHRAARRRLAQRGVRRDPGVAARRR